MAGSGCHGTGNDLTGCDAMLPVVQEDRGGGVGGQQMTVIDMKEGRQSLKAIVPCQFLHGCTSGHPLCG